MSFTVPHAWVAGDDATAAFLQTMTAAIAELQAQYVGRFRQSVAQGLSTGVAAPITFDQEDIDDPSGGHSTVTNTSRFTCVTAGYHLFGGVAGFDITGGGTATVGNRLARWAVNGSAITSTQVGFLTVPNGSQLLFALPTVELLLAAGDFVELQAAQSSGGTLNTYVSGSSASGMTVALTRRT